MASVKGEKSTSWIVSLIVLVFVGVIAFVLADFFLPVYRWQNVDFNAIATENELNVSEIQEPREVYFRYAPRRPRLEDPYPYQLMVQQESETPSWVKGEDGQKAEEYQTLVRVHLISDRTGDRPRFIEAATATHYDWYFKAKAWRLPAGSLGKNSRRPILMVDHSTLEKLDQSQAINWHNRVESGLKASPDLDHSWVSDDRWPDRYDGFGPEPE